MEEENFSFIHWSIIHELATERISEDDFETCGDDQIIELAFEEMVNHAKAFEQWETVAYLAGGDVKILALKKMAELAETLKEWASVHSIATHCEGDQSEIKSKAINKIKECEELRNKN